MLLAACYVFLLFLPITAQRSLISTIKRSYKDDDDGHSLELLELAKHITLHVNGEPLLKRSSSHSSPVPQRFCLLSGLPNLLNDDTLLMHVCNRKCVIIPNKKILDLLNQESISGACSAINSTRNLP